MSLQTKRREEKITVKRTLDALFVVRFDISTRLQERGHVLFRRVCRMVRISAPQQGCPFVPLFIGKTHRLSTSRSVDVRVSTRGERIFSRTLKDYSFVKRKIAGSALTRRITVIRRSTSFCRRKTASIRCQGLPYAIHAPVQTRASRRRRRRHAADFERGEENKINRSTVANGR